MLTVRTEIASMKWLPPNGATQVSACGNFVVVKANSQDWIAYRLTKFHTGDELGVRKSDAEARQCCEDTAARVAA